MGLPIGKKFTIVSKGTTKCLNTIDIFDVCVWGGRGSGCAIGVTDRHLLRQKERIIRANIPL